MDQIEQLADIGFTEYEARVYLALLGDYPATGYQISKNAGVPRSMVYEALGRLKSRGAVLETISDRAAFYRPLPPDVLLDNHEQAHRRLIGNLRESLGALYESQDEERVWSIGGRGSVLSYASQMISQAERELYLVLDDPDLHALQGEIAAAHARGVEIGAVLTGEADLALGQAVRHPPLETELHEMAGTLLVVADNREVLAASCAATQSLVGASEAQLLATIARNRHLVTIARQFVWMELFAQRVFGRLGPDLLERLDVDDRRIFESIGS